MIKIQLNGLKSARLSTQRFAKNRTGRRCGAERFEVVFPVRPSMNAPFAGSLCRLEAVKAALAATLTSKRVQRGETEVQFLPFAHAVTLVPLHLIPLFRLDELLRRLRGIELKPERLGTSADALETALDLLRYAQTHRRRCRHKIVLFIDGESEAAQAAYADPVRRCRQEGVTLDVIPLTANCDQQLAAWLARETGGRCQLALSAVALADAVARAFSVGRPSR